MCLQGAEQGLSTSQVSLAMGSRPGPWDLASRNPEGGGQTQPALLLQKQRQHVSLDLVVSNDKADQANSLGGGVEGREKGAPPGQALLRGGEATAWETAGMEKIIIIY